jgi:hypothetical protein
MPITCSSLNLDRFISGPFSGPDSSLNWTSSGGSRQLQTKREQFPLLACRVYARLLDQAQTAGRLEQALTAGLKPVLLDPMQALMRSATNFLAASNPGGKAAIDLRWPMLG